MAYRLDVKEKARELRMRGYSLKEISDFLKIAKSTASDWLSSIDLSLHAQERLKKKRILGQYKTILLKRKLKNIQKKFDETKARKVIKDINFSKNYIKVCCALIWWCEGNKNSSYARFTNSDASLIQNYLSLLRKGFSIDESKFRALIHLHSYHNEKVQIKFWSEVTKIPLNQFYKSYQKQNSGKRKHKDYPGCIAISYYDVKIAKELEAIYNAFTLNELGAFVNG